MSDEDQPGAIEYELVMPFVVVTSKGVPYDDEAFVAGWSCAVIDNALSVLAPWRASFQRTVRADVLPQVDLIAMKHEYQLTHSDPDADKERNDGWVMITLSPIVAP